MSADTGGDGAPRPTTVTRVDERLGLAIDRAGLSPRTLVTYARDHVTVRTPSRPDFHDGNTIDLVAPPAVGQLAGWLERFAETVGILGAHRAQLRWEEPLAQDAPAAAPRAPEGLATEAAELGLDLQATTVLLLDRLRSSATVDAELVAVAPPRRDPDPDDPADATDRRWHAATVLYRYESGETPDEFRDHDAAFVAWSVDVQRELAMAGRAQVWVAMRHGAPVARLTLLHDRQGLAVVEDVVVHPVHRRRGIASALTHAAVTGHLAADPGARVGIGADPGSGADLLYRRLGFRPHATIWTARQR
ncbi:MAG: GNAT family N-acetyltransferase [Nitriliruptoraceae bacterium]|nr:GNAT family N-acetyltransferase [Nitriliruptoraceae bacterium]